MIQSFVSLSFSSSFDVALRELDFMLEVVIIDNNTLIASRVYRNCVLDIFRVSFITDHFPIPMSDICLAVGMN